MAARDFRETYGKTVAVPAPPPPGSVEGPPPSSLRSLAGAP